MSQSDLTVLGQWTVHPAQNQLCHNDNPNHGTVKLKHKEMQLLLHLIRHAGEEVSHEDIFDSVWSDRVVTRDVLSVAVSQIRKALGDAPREPRYIQTIPGVGYKLIAKVGESVKKEPKLPPVQLAPKRRRKKWPMHIRQGLRFVFWFSFLLIVGATSYQVYDIFSVTLAHKEGNEASLNRRAGMIAVLPVMNHASNESVALWARGLTDTLISKLSKNRRLNVISRTSVMSIKRQQLTLPQISEKLNAAVLLESSLIKVDDQLALTVQLMDGDSEKSLWTHQFAGIWLDNNALLNEITSKVVKAVETNLLPPLKRKVDDVEPEPEKVVDGKVLKLYHQAQALLHSGKKQSVQMSMQLFQQALTLAPDFGLAYTGIAAAKLHLASESLEKLQANRRQIDDLINKGISLDQDQGEAFALRGRLLFLYDWDFLRADWHFQKALALSPNAANIHFEYAQFLLATSRFREALTYVRRGQKLDPLAYSIPIVAWIHNMSRNYAAAEKEMEHLIPIDTNTLVYHLTAQNLFENMGQDDKAFKHYLQIFQLSGYSDDDLQEAIIASGHTGLKGLNRWLAYDKQEEGNIGQYNPPLSMARYLTKAGKKEEALDWLEKALEARQVEILWANIDPKYDALRSHPRFIAVMKKIGFETVEELP